MVRRDAARAGRRVLLAFVLATAVPAGGRLDPPILFPVRSAEDVHFAKAMLTTCSEQIEASLKKKGASNTAGTERGRFESLMLSVRDLQTKVSASQDPEVRRTQPIVDQFAAAMATTKGQVDTKVKKALEDYTAMQKRREEEELASRRAGWVSGGPRSTPSKPGGGFVYQSPSYSVSTSGRDNPYPRWSSNYSSYDSIWSPSKYYQNKYSY